MGRRGNGYSEFNYYLNENGKLVHYGSRPRAYLTDVLARKGSAFVHSAAASRKPFFLEIATFAPHRPYTPAPRDAADFPGLQAPRTPAFNEQDLLDKPSWLRDHPLLTPTQIRQRYVHLNRQNERLQPARPLPDGNDPERAGAADAVGRQRGR